MTRLHFITLWLVVCVFYAGTAQISKLDSLKASLQSTQNDTQRVRMLNDIAYEVRNTKPDTSLLYGGQAHALAEALRNDLELIRSKCVLGIYQQKNGAFDSAYNYFNQALQISRKSGNQAGIARALNLIGRNYSMKSNYAIAEGYYQEALEIFIALNDDAGLAELLKDFGVIYTDQGYYHTALDYCQRALDLYKKIGDVAGESDQYNNIAILYGYRQEYHKALEYFKKSMAISNTLKDALSEKIALNNIGFAYKQIGDYPEALKNLFAALNLSRKMGQKCDDYYPLYNIGSIYQQTGHLDSAKIYLRNSLAGAKQCSDQYIIALSLIDLGHIELKRDESDQARSYYEEAFERARTSGLKAEMKDAARAISVLHETLGEPLKALEYYKIFHSIKDSLFSQENTNKLARLEAKFEFEQERKEAELMRKLETFEKDRKLQEAIWLRNSFIIGFGLMLLVSFLIYGIYQRKQKANRTLNTLNAEIGMQKEELLGRTNELKKANDEISRINQNLESIVDERTKVITAQNNKILDYVFYNSHQVRGPLTRILGLTSLFETSELNKKETTKMLSDIDSAAKELDDMVKTMSETLENEKEYSRAIPKK